MDQPNQLSEDNVSVSPLRVPCKQAFHNFADELTTGNLDSKTSVEIMKLLAIFMPTEM
jgi:ABC-type lipoprotein export system ATPase subunit